MIAQTVEFFAFVYLFIYLIPCSVLFSVNILFYQWYRLFFPFFKKRNKKINLIQMQYL